MIKSLLLKLGMLSIAIGVVFWSRTPPQTVQPTPPDPEKPFMASQATEPEGQENRSSSSSHQNVPGPIIHAPSHAPIHSPLDINRANASELESLPGIGTVLARRVIAFRESVGRFHTIEDLRSVKGIGAKKFERLKSFVMVSAAHS
ncbi:MAG: helix-hairpin-helix domain-containing protein [Nitrospira sp.]